PSTHVKRVLASISAGRRATGKPGTEIAHAACSAPIGSKPLGARQLLLLGLATRLTDGYAAAAPRLREALGAYRAEEPRLDWLSVSYNIAAQELWDDQAWFEFASG